MTQAQRLQEFADREGSVLEALQAHFTPEVQQAVTDKLSSAHLATTPEQTVSFLRAGAKILGQAVAPVVACRTACSACCHAPVILLASEAAVIGAEIGIPPEVVPMEMRNAEPPTWRGKGHACLFLRDDKCSIYEWRPMACRLLYNLDRDAYLCQHNEERNVVPYIDTSEFQAQVVTSLGVRSTDEYYAELRQFFPVVVKPDVQGSNGQTPPAAGGET